MLTYYESDAAGQVDWTADKTVSLLLQAFHREGRCGDVCACMHVCDSLSLTHMQTQHTLAYERISSIPSKPKCLSTQSLPTEWPTNWNNERRVHHKNATERQGRAGGRVGRSQAKPA